MPRLYFLNMVFDALLESTCDYVVGIYVMASFGMCPSSVFLENASFSKLLNQLMLAI